MKTLLAIQRETAKEFRVHNARFAPFSLRIAEEIKKRMAEIHGLQNEALSKGDAIIFNDLGARFEELQEFIGELNIEENILKISIEVKKNEEMK